jgi:hypothetical protein
VSTSCHLSIIIGFSHALANTKPANNQAGPDQTITGLFFNLFFDLLPESLILFTIYLYGSIILILFFLVE